MSKKKQGGKTKQQKRANPKYLGLKVSDGQIVKTGQILVRQRGTRFKAGIGAKTGRDHTIYSIISGKVKFWKSQGKNTISVNSG